MSKSAILDTDYYIANGLGSLLFGSKFYAEAEAIYARLPESATRALADTIPLTTDIKWSSMLMSVKKYWDTTGNRPPARNGRTREAAYGRWLSAQRVAKKQGKLLKDREEALDRLIPAWNDAVQKTRKEEHDAIWAENLDECKTFLSLTGQLPQVAKVDSGAEWLIRQRIKAGKGILRADRKVILDSELPNWNQHRHDLLWQNKLKDVKKYVDSNGAFPSTESDDAGVKKLGVWITNQRSFLKLGKLSDERKEALDSTFSEWVIDHNKPWETKFGMLGEFIDAHGRMPSSGEGSSNEEKTLARWIDKQRNRLRLNRMTADQKTLMDQNFPYWKGGILESLWDKKLDEVVASISEHGEVREDTLSTWLYKQRMDFRNGDLNESRLEKLNQKFPEWNVPSADMKWEENLSMVVAYIQDNGVFPSVYYDFENSTESADWIYMQRWRLSQGILPEDQQRILDEKVLSWRSGAIWDSKWEAKLKDCIEFISEHDRFPSANSKGALEEAGGKERVLGKWLESQRKHLETGKLPKNREESLDLQILHWRIGHDGRNFMSKVAAFAQYVENNGKWPEPSSRLRAWLYDQRGKFRRGKLPQYCIDAFNESIPDWQRGMRQ